MGISPMQVDIGREASSGFQSGPRTASRPHERDNQRSEAVNGGGFQSMIKRDNELPVAGPEQKDEVTND
jgi:hypothetical protein